MKTKECNKCGVKICSKNILRDYSKQCKHCSYSATYCTIKFTPEESKIVKSNSHKISLKLSYIRNKEARQAYDSKWQENNYKKLTEYRQQYLIDNRETMNNSVKKWKVNNKDKANKNAVISRKKARESLNDSYVKQAIIGKTKIVSKDIPQELIELKRKQLKLYRYGKDES